MTHLSRSDTDKMFSDMADRGSADDDEYPHYDEEDFDSEMSGSGDYCEFQMNFRNGTSIFDPFYNSVFFLLLLHSSTNTKCNIC